MWDISALNISKKSNIYVLNFPKLRYLHPLIRSQPYLQVTQRFDKEQLRFIVAPRFKEVIAHKARARKFTMSELQKIRIKTATQTLQTTARVITSSTAEESRRFLLRRRIEHYAPKFSSIRSR